MNADEKRRKIKNLVSKMLSESFDKINWDIDSLLKSGAIDIDGWDESNNPMILPRCIVVAFLARESEGYSAKGTSFEREVKREVKNIEKFI